MFKDEEWVVDVSGLDLEADMVRAETRTWATEIDRELSLGSGALNVVGAPVGGLQLDPSYIDMGPGEIITFSPDTLEENFLRQLRSAPAIPSPFDLCTIHDPSEVRITGRESYFFDEEESNGPKILKVFAQFVRQEPVYISLKAATPHRGIDLIKAVLLQVLAREIQSHGFTNNEKAYNLYIADGMGNSEVSMNPGAPIGNFDCFAIQPKPIARVGTQELATGMQPSTASDIRLTVRVHDAVAKKVYTHECIAPADMVAGRLEPMIARLLPNNRIMRNSIRIYCCDAWVRPWETCDLGPGIGASTGTIGEHTMLSLYRCGVRTVEVQTTGGRVVNPNDAGTRDDVKDVQMSLTGAKATHKVEVVRIDANSTRQPRILIVTAEELITSRYGGVGFPVNNKVRKIADIEKLTIDSPRRTIRFEYKHPWRTPPEVDVFEFTSANKCMGVYKKLTILREQMSEENAGKNLWFRLWNTWKRRGSVKNDNEENDESKDRGSGEEEGEERRENATH
eukprot:gene2199-1366_t